MFLKLIGQGCQKFITGIQISAKRFFDYHTRPTSRSHANLLDSQPTFTKDIRWNGEIKESIAPSARRTCFKLANVGDKSAVGIYIAVGLASMVVALVQEIVHDDF
jgi:hypothetical protein